MKTRHRLGLGLTGAAVLALGIGFGSPAGAHVSGDKDTVPAGGFTQITFTIPHGCEESPTTQFAVQIPESITSAAPQVLAGWPVETTMAPLEEPIEEEGEEAQTERVSEITWTADPGNELPSPYRQTFTVGFQAPETPGEDLVFNMIQTCVEGEVAWIEETPEGGEEPEHPAVVVSVGEAEGDGHGGGEEEEAGEEDTTTTEASSNGDDASSDEDSGDDDSSNGIAIAGLVMGGLGLAAGGTALVKSRSAG